MTEFKPDCEYEIVLIQNESDLTCQVNYTVPECVQTICNCSKYAPRPKILSVQPTHGSDSDMDYFVIKWDPGIKTIKGADYHITLVTFSLYYYIFSNAFKLFWKFLAHRERPIMARQILSQPTIPCMSQ